MNMFAHVYHWSLIALLVLMFFFAPSASAQSSGVIVVSVGGSLWAVDPHTPLSHGERHPLFHSLSVDRSPAFSARTGMLAFDRTAPGGRRIIYVADAVGALRPLIDGRQPDFSPGGTRVVVSRSKGLFIVDVANGSPVRQLTNNASDSNPSWGSDGIVAFDRRSGGKRDIFIVRANRSSPRRIVSTSLGTTLPRRSPDGRTLLISGDRKSRRGCATPGINIRARGRYRIILLPFIDTNPCYPAVAWSPGGRYFAIPAGDRMRIMNAIGSIKPSEFEDVCIDLFPAKPVLGAVWAPSSTGLWLLTAPPDRWNCGAPGGAVSRYCFYVNRRKVCIKV